MWLDNKKIVVIGGTTGGEEVWIMMLEPTLTVNTGLVENERTRKRLESI